MKKFELSDADYATLVEVLCLVMNNGFRMAREEENKEFAKELEAHSYEFESLLNRIAEQAN